MRKDRVEDVKGGGIKSLWKRNEAAVVIDCTTAWAQLDPKGMKRFFKAVMDDKQVRYFNRPAYATMPTFSCQIAIFCF